MLQEKSSFHHLKLSMHKQSQHVGEVSWHQYSSALRDTMVGVYCRGGYFVCLFVCFVCVYGLLLINFII